MILGAFRQLLLALAITSAFGGWAQAQLITGDDGLIDKFNSLSADRPVTAHDGLGALPPA